MLDEAENSMGQGEGWGGQCVHLASEGICGIWPVGTGTAVAKSREKQAAGADSESSSRFLAALETRHPVGSQRGCHGN